jgi:hypothetical protein
MPWFKKNTNRTFDPDAPLALWMSDAEYGQIRAVLATLRPKRCVEWGSGGSTRFFLEHHPFIERYISIEHNPEWGAKVTREVQDPRLEFFVVPPDIPCRPYNWDKPKERQWLKDWRLRAETDPTVMAAYIAKPATVIDTIDFAFIDGRARTFCAAEAFRMLRPGGVLMVHDAEREEYHAMLHSLGDALFLGGWSDGQLAMVRKPDVA